MYTHQYEKWAGANGHENVCAHVSADVRGVRMPGFPSLLYPSLPYSLLSSLPAQPPFGAHSFLSLLVPRA